MPDPMRMEPWQTRSSIRLKAETDATNNNLARSTVAEVYAQILDDLNFAEANLPVNMVQLLQHKLQTQHVPT